MPDRDIEYLTLSTFQKVLSDVTGIASGYISMKMPDDEFLTFINGVNNKPEANAQYKFPRIGVRYFGRVKYNSNTTGDEILRDMGDGTAILYEPMGEINFPVTIYLFTNSRREQTIIGNKLFRELSAQNFYEFIGDEIEGEYFGVKFLGFNDHPNLQPYIKCYDLMLGARTLDEVSGYVTNSFFVQTTTQFGTTVLTPSSSGNVTDNFSYFEPNPPDEIDDDTIYFQDWNTTMIVPLNDDEGSELDLMEEFGPDE